MTRTVLPNASTAGPHLVLYDGVCGFCNGIVRFIVSRDRAGHFHFASLQSPVAAAHLEPFRIDPVELSTLVLIVNYQRPDAQPLTRASAVLFLAKTLGWPWRLATIARLAPLAFLDRLYDVAARNRYVITGRREYCFIPGPDVRARFLE